MFLFQQINYQTNKLSEKITVNNFSFQNQLNQNQFNVELLSEENSTAEENLTAKFLLRKSKSDGQEAERIEFLFKLKEEKL